MTSPANAPRLTLLALGAAAAIAGCQSTSTTEAPARGQMTTAAPDALVIALSDAVKSEDRDALRSLFGPRAPELKSDDPDQNAADLETFAAQLAKGWSVSSVDEQTSELLIGPESWPFAVPLVTDGEVWWFDTDTGIDELISRRVGRNELKTIDACITLFNAQRDYFSQDRDGDGVQEYAARLMSTEGKRDGLYWPAPGGVDPSPIGPALALAAVRTDSSGERIPFWGYRYHLLTAQAAAAPGGAMSYSSSNGLTGGWAVVAYPAEYDQTGVMSFLVSHHGILYQRDLGSSSASTAERMTQFDPTGWERVSLSSQ